MNVHGRRPIRIAHRGGNSRSRLREALAVGVDWIEVDIRLHYGRLVARHDRSIWRLPITYRRWSVALHLAPAVVLDTLLHATQGTATRVLIDLKGGHPGLPDALVRVLRSRDDFARVALCGQEWALLDRARALDPRVELIYSLGKPEHLPRYLARRRDGTAPQIVSCFHGLLTPARVAGLKEAGSAIIAWTVDAEERAHQLLDWGVDGITSNRLTMLRRLWPGSMQGDAERCHRAECQDVADGGYTVRAWTR